MYRIRKSRKYDNVFHIYRNKRKVGRITGGMESIVYIPARGKFVFKIYPGKIPEMFKGVAQTTPKIPDERYTIAEKNTRLSKNFRQKHSSSARTSTKLRILQDCSTDAQPSYSRKGSSQKAYKETTY